jgi:hypothetical protein
VELNESNQPVVISRFHWNILTLWVNPPVIEKKPVIRFTRGVHTPMCFSPHCIYVGKTRYLGALDEIWLEGLLRYFKREMSKTRHIANSQITGYRSIIEEKKPPSQYSFDLSNIKCYVCICENPPKSKDIPKQLQRILDM